MTETGSLGALQPPSSGSKMAVLARLNEQAGAGGVERALRLMEARWGRMKKDDKAQEIDVKLWVNALGMFDLETLKRQSVEACSKFKFWPSLAEFRALCVEDRKHLADSAGVQLNRRPKLEGPPECPIAVEARRRDAELRALQNRLMREANEPPIDWSKKHADEFARIQPYVDRARKELGYVD